MLLAVVVPSALAPESADQDEGFVLPQHHAFGGTGGPMARFLVAQIGQGVAPGIGVLVTGGDYGSGLLAVPVHPPAGVVPFPARLHVLLVLVPGSDSPEEILPLL